MSNEIPKGELTHKFTVAVRCDPYFLRYHNKPVSFIDRLKFNLASKVWDNGCVYLQLENSENQKTNFFYDKTTTGKNFLIKAAIVYAACLADISQNFTPLPVLLKGFASLIIPAIPGLASRGILRRKAKVASPDIACSFPIDAETYKELKDELNAVANKKHGIYFLPFNNCASYAVNFAHKHGYEVPSPVWKTPSGVASKMIEEMKKEPVGSQSSIHFV